MGKKHIKVTATAEHSEVNKASHIMFYAAASIALLTLAVYLPALTNGFVEGWDDSSYILENINVHSLNWKFLQWALFNTSVAMYWHPITWLSHALDFSIWAGNPFGHHLTNVLLHAINTGIVFLLTVTLLKVAIETRRTTIKTEIFNNHQLLITASVTGLLFGIHPIHVESVAWIAQRKDLLYSLFYMLSVITYIRYARSVKPQQAFYLNGHYVGAALFFILALCSKPMAVTLPAVLLLIDWYPLNRIHSKRHLAALLVEKLPLFALSGFVSILAVVAQRTGTIKPFETVSFDSRLLVVCRGLMLYIWKLIAPVNLLPLYPYPIDASLAKPEYVVAIVAVIIISMLCLLALNKHPVWLTGWGFFIISVLPVIGLFQHAGSQNMADRYIYLASFGPFFLLGLAITWVWTKTVHIQKYSFFFRNALKVALMASFLSLSYLTVKQIGVWQNALTIWNYLILKEPEFREGYFRRGEAFSSKGMYNKAINDYTTALRIDPTYGSAYINRASTYFGIGLLDQALTDATRAIAVEPTSADAYTIRGNIYNKKGEYNLAIAEYDLAISKKPSFYPAYLNRAITHRSRGDIDKAIEDFSKALTLGKGNMNNEAAVYMSRGDLFLKKGVIDLATQDFQKACDLGNKSGCNKALFPFQTN